MYVLTLITTTVLPLSAFVSNYVFVISYEFILSMKACWCNTLCGELQSIVIIYYMLDVNCLFVDIKGADGTFRIDSKVPELGSVQIFRGCI
jgi:hypothetical protein